MDDNNKELTKAIMALVNNISYEIKSLKTDINDLKVQINEIEKKQNDLNEKLTKKRFYFF